MESATPAEYRLPKKRRGFFSLMKERSVVVDQLSVFSLLWAVATLIHQASFAGWIAETRPLGWLLTGLAALVIF